MVIIIKKLQLQSYLTNLFNSEAINIDEKFQQSRTLKSFSPFMLLYCAQIDYANISISLLAFHSFLFCIIVPDGNEDSMT